MDNKVANRTDELERINQQLEEHERLIEAFHKIGRVLLTALDQARVLDILVEQVLEAGIFRSLTVALVDDKAAEIHVVRDVYRHAIDGKIVPGNAASSEVPHPAYALDGDSIMAEVARTGARLVIDGWDERFDGRISKPDFHDGKVSYFIPVKKEDRVLAVLATGSDAADKEGHLRRIEAMAPLLDLVAIALEQARLYGEIVSREAELQQRMKQRDALLKIGEAIQRISHSSQMGQVVVACLAAIQNMGANVQAMAINRVIDAEQALVETFRVGPDGLITNGERRKSATAAHLWKTGELLREDILEDRSEEEIVYFRSKFDNLAIQSFVDIPFSAGVMSVHSTAPNAFLASDVEFFKQAAQTLSVGITRIEDLERLEAHNRALAESEARYHNLIRLANGVAYTCDWREGRYTYMDESVVELIGYKASDLTVALFQSLVEERNVIARHEPLPETIQLASSGQPPMLYRAEYRLKTRDGQPVWVADYALEFRDQNNVLVQSMGLMQDITERRMLEEGLRQSQKMEAIGQLAGGVAHDFNNLLTGILGTASMLLAEMAPDDSLRADLEEIQRAGERAASLTGQLLAFSRKQVLQPKLLDLNAVVSDMQKMLRRLVREDIDLVVSLGTATGPVKADPGQLEQVIMNLVVNASDAMPEGGILTIETDCIAFDAFHARRRDLRPGRYLALMVRDTGQGMDEMTQARIFEPFFTTKGPGQGTGMGLSTVYGIVKQSGGHIEVDSQRGMGTTFSVFLPRAEETPAEGLPEAVSDLPHGSETILLTEDDEIVRRLTHRMLGRLGYRVLVARNGREALSQWVGNEGDIALLVTDVVMPEMSGKELAARLKSEQPALRVLFMSGYTDQVIGHHGVLERETAFLQKPFTPEELAAKVREVLDG